ncbi:hypothetical protein VP01_264g1 [Puccinia sorghi]|uniref:Major facilitator superfamily (MFS) profile domain-containing protein n=1 Tax=Puccinia sorghi TaxID=27349 RepID=A0A0L6V496_9BASI|nr:hypothetical protein VP01_264g1 [Puccinia sorghi]
MSSSPTQHNSHPESNPMTFAHSSSIVEADQKAVLTEKRLDALDVTEKSSPSNSLQLLPPREWKYAKFFPELDVGRQHCRWNCHHVVFSSSADPSPLIIFILFFFPLLLLQPTLITIIRIHGEYYLGVNNTLDYQQKMGIFSQPQTEADSAKIGGQVFALLKSTPISGTFIGALIGGSLGDRIGRLKTIVFACFWAMFGASLQASAQNVTL